MDCMGCLATQCAQQVHPSHVARLHRAKSHPHPACSKSHSAALMTALTTTVLFRVHTWCCSHCFLLFFVLLLPGTETGAAAKCTTIASGNSRYGPYLWACTRAAPLPCFTSPIAGACQSWTAYSLRLHDSCSSWQQLLSQSSQAGLSRALAPCRCKHQAGLESRLYALLAHQHRPGCTRATAVGAAGVALQV